MGVRLVYFLLVWFAVSVGGDGAWAEVGKTGGDVVAGRHKPLTVVASTKGRFSKGHSWQVSVNAAGQGALVVETYPVRKEERFTVSEEQLQELREAVDRERFFDLSAEYGDNVTDGSWDSLTIVVGERAHTVRLGFFMNWVQSDPGRLREPGRAIRVFNVVRNWFSAEEAVDLRRYDTMVLEALARHDLQTSGAALTE